MVCIVMILDIEFETRNDTPIILRRIYVQYSFDTTTNVRVCTVVRLFPAHHFYFENIKMQCVMRACVRACGSMHERTRAK